MVAVSTEYSCRASKLSLLHLVPGLRTRRLLSIPIIELCSVFTARLSLYVPPSGHCIYRTVVTICTAQWSLYVPHSGHYMYRPVVTVCTAQWSLYVAPIGHCMYRTVVTTCATRLNGKNSTFCPHSVFMCFVWISEQTAIISLYNIN